jgi:WD40 repeat protein
MTEPTKKTAWQVLVRVGAILGAIAGGLVLCVFILALFGPTISSLFDPEVRDKAANDSFCQEAIADQTPLTGEALQTFELPEDQPVVTLDNVGDMVEVASFDTIDTGFGYALRLTEGTAELVPDPDWNGTKMELSPDGSLLITIQDRPSQYAIIRACDVGTGKAIKAWTTDETTRAVAFTPDGSRFILNEGRSMLLLYDTENLRRIDRWDVRAGEDWWRTDFAAMHPSGAIVAFTANRDSPGSDIRLWDVAEGRQVGVLPGHPDTVIDMQWNADGSLLVTYGLDGTLRLWAVQE